MLLWRSKCLDIDIVYYTFGDWGWKTSLTSLGLIVRCKPPLLRSSYTVLNRLFNNTSGLKS